MKHTMSESIYTSSNRRGTFVRNGRLVKAVTLALVLGLSGVVGGMVQAAGVTDTTEKGGVAVNLSSDAAKGATAQTDSSIAIGENAVVNNSKRPGEPGGSSISIGKDSISGTYGANNIAIGTSAKSTFKGDVAIGHKSSAAGAYSTAVGDDSHASALASIALGHGANARNSYSMAIGMAADVNRDKSMAIGPWARVEARNSVALGYYSSVQKDDIKDGTAKFSNEKVKASSGVVSVGTKEYTVKSTITLDDDDNDVSTSLSIPEEKRRIINVAGGIDDNDAVNVAQLTAVANQIKSGNKYINIKDSDYSLAIGVSSAASNQWATALGTSSKAGGFASLALGVGSKTTEGAERAVAIGLNSYVGDLTEEFEKYKIVENPTVLIDDSEELAGEYVSIDGSPKSEDKPSVPKEDINTPQLNSIAIGQGTKTSGYQATAIGQGARAYGASAIAMGLASRAILDDTIAIGSQVAASAKGAIGMGRFANSFAYDSIAIGDRTAVGSKANFGTTIGAWSRVNGKNSVALGSFSSTEGIDFETDGVAKYSGEKVKAQHGVVSVGSHAYTIKFSENDMNIPDIKRRIVNVAGGINDNDAVNVKQLTAVAESPVYIYNGGSVSNEVYTIGTAVVPEANKNYTISNLRFAFTDGLTAGTVTDSNGNKLVKVGISDDYMNKINRAVADAKTAQEKAEAAQGKAEDAQGKAEVAQGKAEAAQGKAEEAQGKAEAAQGKAEAAQGKAKDAQGKAEVAQGKAEDAQGKAEAAQGKAEDAQGKAEAAQGKAEDAQGKAEDAQGKAEDAQGKAEVAQGKAEDAQGKAEAAQG
uniref:hypothetical protein n=1 Tax=Veillonella magna TaxID=464322 RepID=UPI0023F0F4E3